MRAMTIEANGHIAIMTKDTEPIRESFVDKPLIEFISAPNLFPMLSAKTLDMIYGKKFHPVLTTTGTFSTIAGKNHFSSFFMIYMIAFFNTIRVIFDPSSIFFSVLFGIVLRPLLSYFSVALITYCL